MNSTIKKLFILGMLMQLAAQAMFSVPSSVIDLLEPIDFIHFTLLIGVVLIIPYALQFSHGLYRSIGATSTLIGVVANIGMCAIDLVLWSLRHSPEQRNELAWALMAEPSIWPVFFTVGPAFMMVGLAFQALGYRTQQPIAAMAVLAGSIAIGIGGLILTDIRIVFMLGYVLFAAGLIKLALAK